MDRVIKLYDKYYLDTPNINDNLISVCIPMNKVATMLESVSKDTRKLLNEKGFINTLKEGVLEKVVLLNTEVAELTDAIKKNLGKNEEGMELADIVIRASNFCCAEDHYVQFKDFIKNYTKDRYDSLVFAIINTDEVIEKFLIIDKMIEKVSNISTDKSIKNINRPSCNLNNIYNEVLDVVSLCCFYSERYLGKNLQFFVDEKMSKNFKRPYRYNSKGLQV